MGLSEDQRALLNLLVGGDTYERIADVLGASPAEVRERAREAAAALEREPTPDLSPAIVAERLRARETGGTAARPSAPAPSVTPLRRRSAAVLVAGGALVLLAVVLALTLLDGNGGDAPQPPPRQAEEDAVVVELSPVGGSGASGTVTIARIEDQPAVDLEIAGLDPSGPGETYVLWFVGSDGRALPIAFQAVGQDGKISGRTPIPRAATGLLPSFETAELSLASKRDAVAAIEEATGSQTLPDRVGTPVLRGALRG